MQTDPYSNNYLISLVENYLALMLYKWTVFYIAFSTPKEYPISEKSNIKSLLYHMSDKTSNLML